VFRPLAGEPNPFGDPPRGQPYLAELPLSKFRSEAELAERVAERLDPWFEVKREVWGTHCSGRRHRVDAMIRPRDSGRWKNPDVAFGIEFKIPKDGVNAWTRWLAQAVSYTHTDWDGYGRRRILTCPGVTSWLDEDPSGSNPGRRDAFMAKRISGQLGVGELVLRWHYGLTILVNGEHIWSERYKVRRGQHWALNLESGSL
jgi:hypothetical protein